MNSNVHALEGITPLRTEVGRPDRADVEAAFRTIFDGPAMIQNGRA
jgi:hypothetical protein